MVKILAVFLLLCGGVQSSFSQTGESDTLEYTYPTEVLITAPRFYVPLREVPFSTSIMGTEVLRMLPRGIAIDEPVKLVPGLKVDNQANGSRVHVSIRGQGILTERGIRGIKVLLDKISINDPTGFAPDLFDIDYNTLERIEVLRGPAASLYGSSASGGIINITTKNADNIPLTGEASATFGSNNFWKAYAQFGGNVEDVNYLVSLSRTMGKGYRDHTHFWGNKVYGKATYTPASSFTLTPIFSWTDFYHENPEGINLQQYKENPRQANPDAIPFNEFLETNRVTNGLAGLFSIEQHEIEFNCYVKRTLFTEANNRTFNRRTIVTPGVSFQYSYRFGSEEDSYRNTLSVGTDLQWQTINERRTDNLYAIEVDTVRSKERIRQNGVGVYIFDKLTLAKDLGVMLSLRYDRIRNELNDLMKTPYDLSGDAEFSKTTGRVGLTYSPMQSLNFFASWGQGFLPPATEELAQNPDNFGGFNKHLISATSNCFELGARGTATADVYYDVTAFSMITDNDFDRYRITDPLRTQETFYRNAGSSHRYGLEVYTRATLSKLLVGQIAYTYSNFKYTNENPIRIMMDDPTNEKYIMNGNWLPNSPMHQLYLDIEYSYMTNFTIGFGVEMISKTYIDGSNIEKEVADGYTLLHGRIIYGLSIVGVNGELIVSARNLTNKTYVAFTEPDPGGNAYQPGAGREYFGGIRIYL